MAYDFRQLAGYTTEELAFADQVEAARAKLKAGDITGAQAEYGKAYGMIVNMAAPDANNPATFRKTAATIQTNLGADGTAHFVEAIRNNDSFRTLMKGASSELAQQNLDILLKRPGGKEYLTEQLKRYSENPNLDVDQDLQTFLSEKNPQKVRDFLDGKGIKTPGEQTPIEVAEGETPSGEQVIAASVSPAKSQGSGMPDVAAVTAASGSGFASGDLTKIFSQILGPELMKALEPFFKLLSSLLGKSTYGKTGPNEGPAGSVVAENVDPSAEVETKTEVQSVADAAAPAAEQVSAEVAPALRPQGDATMSA